MEYKEIRAYEKPQMGGRGEGGWRLASLCGLGRKDFELAKRGVLSSRAFMVRVINLSWLQTTQEAGRIFLSNLFQGLQEDSFCHHVAFFSSQHVGRNPHFRYVWERQTREYGLKVSSPALRRSCGPWWTTATSTGPGERGFYWMEFNLSW